MPSGAEEAYRKAIAIAPRFALAYDYLMALLLQQERSSEAEQISRQAKALSLDITKRFYVLTAYSLHNNKKYSEAAATYKKAIKNDPKNGNAYLNLGLLLHEELNQPAEAERAYRRSIQLNPTFSVGYFQLAWLLHKRFHRYGEAEVLFAKTLELDPKDETASYNIACIKAITNDFDAAFKYLKDAIQKGFDRAWAWRDPDLTPLHNDPRFVEIVGARPMNKKNP
jgi:superkiller protein 3